MTTMTRGTDTLTRDALTVLQPGFTGTDAPDWLLRRLGEGLASVGLFGRNITSPEQVAALTARLRAEHPDVLVAIDEEGGDVTRLEVRGGSSFPGNLALGAVDDTDLTRAVAGELGRRLAECGVNLNWAPSADVNSDPGNPVIGVRSFGADPHLVARHTAAYVQGLQSAGVAACTKHFPGHGDTSVDSHHHLPRITADLDTLQERELPPFRAAIAAGTRAVMSAHILLPALDGSLPATLSRNVLTGLLRAPAAEGGLGFDGLIVTDAMEMQAVAATYGIERGSVLAVAAGADAICVGGERADEDIVLRLRDALVTAVREGELPEERLAEAAARVRALARWTRGAGAAAGTAPAPAPEAGLNAARRALRVTHRAPAPYVPLTAPAYVAVFSPAANIAVGHETPWGVSAALTDLLPGTTTGRFSAGGSGASGNGAQGNGAEGNGAGNARTGRGAGADSAPDVMAGEVLRAAGDRRIVAVVRDVHRHSWMADALAALVDARPDTIVVEMGVPQAPPTGALHIATHGAARVCGQAAAEFITAPTP
ncbi:glycoside hydrolase family 3 protein [Streptomyces sp. MST-110588]|uniref:glycoside hydrolase family 3 protein n=1 Tax=Streptomyces sp. MST-110588 TaxID=2833628 RepID=UPI001F5D630D|nr:glycoside hydrolase family 3 protein [Streptomyces sp. MST-110588]UNO40009.1 glycoside hydrolase family 3 protein [Streptomyces sp. MST-110588]